MAQRAGYLIFEGRLHGDPRVALIYKKEHPMGRLKTKDLVSDEPGRVSGRISPERHALSPFQVAKEAVADRFARELADFLDIARSQNRFRKLILIAEPRFLGRLRRVLSTQTAARVALTVEKELNQRRWLELEPLVYDWVRSVDRVEGPLRI